MYVMMLRGAMLKGDGGHAPSELPCHTTPTGGYIDVLQYSQLAVLASKQSVTLDTHHRRIAFEKHLACITPTLGSEHLSPCVVVSITVVHELTASISKEVCI